MLNVGVTGATGYVGQLLAYGLLKAGYGVECLSRRPHPTLPHRPFTLENPSSTSLDGLDWLIHAAHDFTLSARELVPKTVESTAALLGGSRESGTRVVLVSTLSAFDGCKSQYGRAKLAAEAMVTAAGGVAIRAGVVCSPEAGGIFGALRGAVASSPVVPLPGGGWQPLHMTSGHALLEVVRTCLEGSGLAAGPPLLAAAREPTSLREIVLDIAHGLGKRPTLVPVPSAAAMAGLRTLGLVGVGGFRADSLLALLNPIPGGQLDLLRQLDVPFEARVRDIGWLGV